MRKAIVLALVLLTLAAVTGNAFAAANGTISPLSKRGTRLMENGTVLPY